MLRRGELLLILIGAFLCLALTTTTIQTTAPSRHHVATTASTLALSTTTSTGAPPSTEAPTTTTTAPDPDPVYPSVGYWEAMHRCEQPNSWTIAGTFGNGLQGGGGLGISNGAWNENGGLQYAPYPGAASPLDQMRVAGHILQRYGPSAWGCKL